MLKNQKQIVLRELREAGDRGITPWEMITRHRITRLSAVIYDLRDENYDIETVRETNGDKNFARYILHEDSQQQLF